MSEAKKKTTTKEENIETTAKASTKTKTAKPANTLVIAILAAAIVLAAALVFLGIRMGSGSGGGDFAQQLAAYEKEQQQEQIDAQAQQEAAAAELAKNVNPIGPDDHVLGNKDAKITLFEYSDFECPFCKRFYETPKQIVADFDGQVNSVFRHFPLSFHEPLASKQALASECVADLVGNDAFWDYHNKIFAATKSGGSGMKESELTTLAVAVGAESSAFKACLDSEELMQKVQNDIQSGADAGVSGTPGNILRNNDTGDVIFLPGAYPIENFNAAINDLLSR